MYLIYIFVGLGGTEKLTRNCLVSLNSSSKNLSLHALSTSSPRYTAREWSPLAWTLWYYLNYYEEQDRLRIGKSSIPSFRCSYVYIVAREAEWLRTIFNVLVLRGCIYIGILNLKIKSDSY